ncbi:MAG: hypothetical protein AAF702_33400 [Chloroflexota bacterium]
MTPQALTLSLMVAIVLLTGIGFYATWLGLALSAIRRSLNHIAVIEAKFPANSRYRSANGQNQSNLCCVPSQKSVRSPNPL